MTVERLLSYLGSPKKTMVYIKAFCANANQYTTLWQGYTYYPNEHLESFKDFLVDTFNIGVSNDGYTELHINITGYYQ